MMAAVGSLSRLLLNVEGPDAVVRQLYTGVGRSMVLRHADPRQGCGVATSVPGKFERGGSNLRATEAIRSVL